MPFVNVQTVKGLLSPEKRTTLIARLTDLMIEVEGDGDERFRPFVLVRIDEHDGDHWAVGGQSLSAITAAALAPPRPA